MSDMKKKLLYILPLFAVIVLILFYLYSSFSKLDTKERKTVYIRTGSTYDEVVALLDSTLGISHKKLFRWIAEKKSYPSTVKAGKYVVEPGMSYNELINMLRSGRQTPVNITFNNIRTLNQLAGKVGGHIEADSSSIMNFLSDESNYSADGFKKETVIAIFIPNTYQVFWNSSPKSFYSRMLKEYRAFWTEQRVSKAKEKGLSPVEVSILASIVDDEVAKKDEKPRIAGVYLNRLKKGMPLQACPTIKFALNDFTITRVLKKYLTVDSPYNTYKHSGFPPGPVGCPSVDGLEAVLNAEQHDYFFFAAKADFSGYHNFSRTLAEHNRYAAAYQKELDRRKIFK
jgi:UPF0755 protein